MLPRQAIHDLPEEKLKKKPAPGIVAVTVTGLINLCGQELDEQLVNHVFNQGLSCIQTLVRHALWRVKFSAILIRKFLLIDKWRDEVVR